MANSYLIFDFGSKEDTAQKARLKVEGWKQGFRLGNKISLKFEREESGQRGTEKPDANQKQSAGKSEKVDGDSHVRVIICLDFSDHEKISLHRWLERIPAEEPFKSVKCEIVRSGDASFAKTSERFDALS